MVISRKERETNQQVLRRFNRLTQQDEKLKKVRDKKYFVKEVSRSMRKQSSVRKEQLRRNKVLY
jgi:ribosomal protein S21